MDDSEILNPPHSRGMTSYGWATASTEPQKHEFRIIVNPPLQFLETIRRRKFRRLGLFDHQQRPRRQPATIAQRYERLLGKLHAIGRIEKHQRERLYGVRGAEIAAGAAVHFCHSTEPQRLDIVAQQRPRLRAIIDEQREPSPSRDRLDAERAGAR